MDTKSDKNGTDVDQPDAIADKPDVRVDKPDARGDPEGQEYRSKGTPLNLYSGERPSMTREEFESDVYRMNHKNRGMAIIINNQHFEPHLKLSDRSGTDLDGMALHAAFKEMGFDVKLQQNKTVQEMMKILYQASKENDYHLDSDCFICAILTHGKEGVVYGTDGESNLQNLLSFFKGNACPGLVGKPKIFFIQACQGQKFDEGVGLDVADARGVMPKEISIKKIPSEADFLLAYSVVPGYYSWRNGKNGSWFIQALTEVLQKSWKELDLLTILTRVNRKVAFDFTSRTSDPEMSDKKQIPMITSMLTKEVRFTPKE